MRVPGRADETLVGLEDSNKPHLEVMVLWAQMLEMLHNC